MRPAYFNVKVFNPFASSLQFTSVLPLYIELDKRQIYDEQICEVERASILDFLLLLFKCIATLTSDKRGHPYCYNYKCFIGSDTASYAH